MDTGEVSEFNMVDITGPIRRSAILCAVIFGVMGATFGAIGGLIYDPSHIWFPILVAAGLAALVGGLLGLLLGSGWVMVRSAFARRANR